MLLIQISINRPKSPYVGTVTQLTITGFELHKSDIGCSRCAKCLLDKGVN